MSSATLQTTSATEAEPTRSRLLRVRPHLLLAGGVLLVSVALHLRDPHEGGSWGFCPWLVTTGTYCPGCGGLRAVNDLTRGDLAAAASSNLAFVAALPVVVGLWARSLTHRWRGHGSALPRSWVIGASVAALAAVAVFSVARNLPAGAWFAP